MTFGTEDRYGQSALRVREPQFKDACPGIWSAITKPLKDAGRDWAQQRAPTLLNHVFIEDYAGNPRRQDIDKPCGGAQDRPP